MNTQVDPRSGSGGKPAPTPAPAPVVVARTDDIVIGLGVTSSGNFTTAGLICVDGVLRDAEVQAAALSISRGGEFHGLASVDRLEVFGTLCGEVVATDQIVLRASAIVLGKLSAPYIITHRGAAISGEVKSLERRPEVQLSPMIARNVGGKGLFRRPTAFSLFMGGLVVLALGGGLALGRMGEKPAPLPAMVAEMASASH
ncbi:MAG: polymer-forming cytoskeletal protein [Gammaproteobacteria bacterium]